MGAKYSINKELKTSIVLNEDLISDFVKTNYLQNTDEGFRRLSDIYVHRGDIIWDGESYFYVTRELETSYWGIYHESELEIATHLTSEIKNELMEIFGKLTTDDLRRTQSVLHELIRAENERQIDKWYEKISSEDRDNISKIIKEIDTMGETLQEVHSFNAIVDITFTPSIETTKDSILPKVYTNQKETNQDEFKNAWKRKETEIWMKADVIIKKLQMYAVKYHTTTSDLYKNFNTYKQRAESAIEFII